jgi:hypothetical protein
MRALASVLALAILPSQVFALSCMRPDVAVSFQAAEAATEAYIVVYGVLSFDETRLPQADWENQAATPQHTRLKAQLAGQALSRRGFSVAFDQDITLDARCYGPWCALPRSGVEALIFLEREEDGGYLAAVDPCYSLYFPEPTQVQLGQAVSCMRGEDCVPSR